MDAEHKLLRSHLIMINAWIDHWREDAKCNLTPTASSLDTAQGRVRRSIEMLDAMQVFAREHDLTIPGEGK